MTDTIDRQAIHEVARTRTLVVLAIIILLFVSSLTVLPIPGTMADVDGNDDYDNAEQVPGNWTLVGTVNSTDDMQDIYKFTVTGGGVLDVWAECNVTSQGSLTITYTDQSRFMVRQMQNLDPGESGSFRYIIPTESSGTNYIEAMETMGLNATYKVIITLSSQDDGDLGQDAPNDPQSAPAVDAGSGLTGELGDGDNMDSYRFTVPQGGHFKVNLSVQDHGPIRMYVNDDGMFLNYQGQDIQSGNHEVYEQLLNNDFGQNFYMQFQGSGNYTFSLDASGQDDGGTGKDAPDQFPSNANMALNDTIHGLIGSMDGMDNYRYTPYQPGQGLWFNITMISPGPGISLDLVTGEGPLNSQMNIDPGQSAEVSIWSAVDDPNSITGFYIGQMGSGEVIEYTVRTALLQPNDHGTGADVKGTMDGMNQGMDIPSMNQTIKGAVGATSGSGLNLPNDMGDRMDRYRFNVPSNRNLTLSGSTDTPGGDISVNIHDDLGGFNDMFQFTETSPSNRTWTIDINMMVGMIFLEVSSTSGRANYSISMVIEEIVDTTPPMLNIGMDPPGEVSDPHLSIQVSASDDMGQVFVKVVVNDQGPTDCMDWGMGSWQCDFDLGPGWNTVVIEATDESGNVANRTYTINYRLTPLDIMFNSHSNGMTVYEEFINLEGNINGMMGQEYVKFSSDGGATWTDVNLNGEMWSISISLTEGENKLSVKVWDDRGRYDQENITIEYKKDGGSGNGGGNGGGNGDGGGGGGPENIQEFFFAIGMVYCLNPFILGLFVAGILCGLLPLALGLRAGIRRSRRKAMEKELEEDMEEEGDEEVTI